MPFSPYNDIKDTNSSRKDLEAHKIRDDLLADMDDHVVGKVEKCQEEIIVIIPPACYSLSPGEFDEIFTYIINVRFSSGHPLSRDKNTLSRMRSDDC